MRVDAHCLLSYVVGRFTPESSNSKEHSPHAVPSHLHVMMCVLRSQDPKEIERECWPRCISSKAAANGKIFF